jgi:hypothetical protein
MPKVGSLPVEAPAYPLEMLRCIDCGLVQIGLEVSQEILFPESYPYLSGSTRILRTNFANLKDESEQLLGLTKDKLVIDIGSNDGTLLSNFHEAGFPSLGIEPSQAADVAMAKGIDTLKTYFNRDIARKVAADLNVVLNDTDLMAEIAAANGSMREVMNRVKRLARRRQSASTP